MIEVPLSHCGCGGCCSAVVRIDRGLSAPLPISVWKDIQKSQSWGSVIWDSRGLDAASPCFEHLEQHLGGGGWSGGASASQDGAIGCLGEGMPLYSSPYFSAAGLLSPDSFPFPSCLCFKTYPSKLWSSIVFLSLNLLQGLLLQHRMDQMPPLQGLV